MCQDLDIRINNMYDLIRGLTDVTKNAEEVPTFFVLNAVIFMNKSQPNVAEGVLGLKETWFRKKQETWTDLSQALKLKPWFKTSQQTKVHDLTASQANFIKHLEKS